MEELPMNTPRRMLCLLLAVLMLLACAPAMAQTQLSAPFAPEYRVNAYNSYSDTVSLIVKQGTSSYYALFDMQGRQLTTDPYIMMKSSSGMWKVAVQSGTNTVGLLDAGGHLFMPMEYGAVDVIDEYWAIGVRLTPATADQYDYKSSDGKSFYLVASYDVYFDGQMVGSLGRTDYSSAYAFGEYLYVRNTTNEYHFYNKSMQESGYDASMGSTEYDEKYVSGKGYEVYHRGSGQQAFVAGCTLTSDEVDCDIYIKNDGKGYDLQGNVLFEVSTHYESIRKYYGNYAAFRVNGKYGLIDRKGQVVLPAEYDEIPSYTTPEGNGYEYFSCGYQAVIKDGKLGYADLNGNITCDFKYAASNARYSTNPNFATIQDLTGNYIVLSAAKGEIGNAYQDVSVSPSRATLISVKNSDGSIDVLDMQGDVVLDNVDIKYVTDVTVSRAGTSMQIGLSNAVYYTISTASVQPVAVQPKAVQPEAAQAESQGKSPASSASLLGILGQAQDSEPEQAPAQDGNWNCTCGNVNTGNFCPNCGAQRPAEEQPIVCSGCGYQPDAENVPNFCPQCGTKFDK